MSLKIEMNCHLLELKLNFVFKVFFVDKRERI